MKSNRKRERSKRVKLGILVRSDKHLEYLVGLTRAAVAKGHEVTVFATDSGVRLLGSPACADLCQLRGVAMSVCEHSAKTHHVPAEGLPKEIVRGSQYDNAVMVQWADRVVVL